MQFGLFRSANSNSISLENLRVRVGCKVGGGGNTSGEYSDIAAIRKWQ